MIDSAPESHDWPIHRTHPGMSKVLPTLLVLSAAIAAAFPAQGATLGSFAPHAEIGSTLRWQIPLEGSDLPLNNTCVRVSATQGDSGLRVTHSVSGNSLVIRSLTPVQEPVVNVRIALGCPATFDRNLVALADLPTQRRAAPTPAAPATPVPVPPTIPSASTPTATSPAPAVAKTIAEAEASGAAVAAATSPAALPAGPAALTTTVAPPATPKSPPKAAPAIAATPSASPAAINVPRISSGDLRNWAQPGGALPPIDADTSPAASILSEPKNASPSMPTGDGLTAAQIRTADEAIARAMGQHSPSQSSKSTGSAKAGAGPSGSTIRHTASSGVKAGNSSPRNTPRSKTGSSSKPNTAKPLPVDLDDTLPLTAGVPRSPSVEDRLRLDPIQQGLTLDDKWIEPSANATNTAGLTDDQIIFGQDAAANEKRILELEKEVGSLRTQATQGGAGINAKPNAPAGSSDSGWPTWALAAGGGVLAVLLGLLLMRQRKAKATPKDTPVFPEGSEDTDVATARKKPKRKTKDPAPPIDPIWAMDPNSSAPAETDHALPNSAVAAAAGAVALVASTTSEAAPPEQPDHTPAATADNAGFFEDAVADKNTPSNPTGLVLDEEWAQQPSDELTAHFHYDDLIDLQQQTDFFAAFEDYDKGVALLGEAVKGRAARCPVAYGQLLELLQRQGDQATYEQVAERYRTMFGAPAPAWDQPVNDGAGLATYPELLQPVEAAAAQPQEAMAILDGILFPSSPELSGLSISAYQDALGRYTDLHQRWSEQGGLSSPAANLPFADDALKHKSSSPAATQAVQTVGVVTAAATAAAVADTITTPTAAEAADSVQADSPLAEFQRLFGAEENSTDASDSAAALAAPSVQADWPSTPQEAQALPVFNTPTDRVSTEDDLLSTFSQAWDEADSIQPGDSQAAITDFAAIPDLPPIPAVQEPAAEPAQTDTSIDADLDFNLDDIDQGPVSAAAPSSAAPASAQEGDIDFDLSSLDFGDAEAVSPAGTPPATEEDVDVDFDALLADMSLEEPASTPAPVPAPAAAAPASAVESDDVDFNFDDLLALSEDGAKASKAAPSAPSKVDPDDDFAALLRSNSGKKF